MTLFAVSASAARRSLKARIASRRLMTVLSDFDVAEDVAEWDADARESAARRHPGD